MNPRVRLAMLAGAGDHRAAVELVSLLGPSLRDSAEDALLADARWLGVRHGLHAGERAEPAHGHPTSEVVASYRRGFAEGVRGPDDIYQDGDALSVSLRDDERRYLVRLAGAGDLEAARRLAWWSSQEADSDSLGAEAEHGYIFSARWLGMTHGRRGLGLKGRDVELEEGARRLGLEHELNDGASWGLADALLSPGLLDVAYQWGFDEGLAAAGNGSVSS